jgi:cytosine/adenosine deaminase-related metal-dependent hydrolase
LFEELPLEFWLLYTLPMGQNRSKEEVRARTLVGAVESLRCGITTVQDMLGLTPLNEAYSDVVLDAYRESGLRVVFSPMVSDVPAIAMVRHKESLPADVQEMLGTGAPMRDQLDYLEHGSSGGRRAAPCIGRWRRSRRSAARRNVGRLRRSRTSTISRSTPMPTRPGRR